MLAKVLVAILAGFAIAIPSTFWLLKKVRIKSKVRHVQVSLALGLPAALFIYLLQTSFALPVIVATISFALVIAAIELALRRIVAHSTSIYFGTFRQGRSGGGLSFEEAVEASGKYPDNYLTEEFWNEQRYARRFLLTQKFELKRKFPEIKGTHNIDSFFSILGKDYSVINGIRNTTDFYEYQSDISQDVFLFGGSPLVGNEVPDRLTSSSFLQRIANSQGVNLRVVNCGANGAGVRGRASMLKGLINPPRNSIVVFVFGCNDLGWYDRRSEKYAADSVFFPLRILRAFVDLGFEFANIFYNKVSPWYHRKFSRRAVDDSILSLSEAFEFCCANSVSMIAILEPNLYIRQTTHGYEKQLRSRFNRDLRTLTIESYKRYGSFVDTVPWAVSATDIFDNSNESVFLDWCHINARGNELIAKFIFEELKKRKLISVDEEV